HHQPELKHSKQHQIPQPPLLLLQKPACNGVSTPADWDPDSEQCGPSGVLWQAAR
ncbi:hypothetical protein NDU88_000721, partial [Pleurodeles waltl]